MSIIRLQSAILDIFLWIWQNGKQWNEDCTTAHAFRVSDYAAIEKFPLGKANYRITLPLSKPSNNASVKLIYLNSPCGQNYLYPSYI